MAYQITLTDGQLFATIPDGTINTSSAMTLVGKNYAGYGAFLDTNFIRLLESGSNSTPPSSPLTGQLWWDSTSNILKVWNGAIFKNIGGATASPTAPTNNVAGDLWFNTAANVLNVYTGTGFLTVGPSVINGTGTEIATIVDTNSVPHTVVETIVNNQIVSINSKDVAFTPATPISGFGNINPGVTVASSIAGVNQAFNGNVNGNLFGNVVIANTVFANGDVTVGGNLNLANVTESTIFTPENGVIFTNNPATPGPNGGSTYVNIVPSSNASPSSNAGGAAVLGMWNSVDSGNAAVLNQAVYAVTSTYPGMPFPSTYGEWGVGAGYVGNSYPISSYYFFPSAGPNNNIPTQVAFRASNVAVYGNLSYEGSLVIQNSDANNWYGSYNLSGGANSQTTSQASYLNMYTTVNLLGNSSQTTFTNAQYNGTPNTAPGPGGLFAINSQRLGTNTNPINQYSLRPDSLNGNIQTLLSVAADTYNFIGTSNVAASPSQPWSTSSGGLTQVKIFPGTSWSTATPQAGAAIKLPNSPDYQTLVGITSETVLYGNGQPASGQLTVQGQTYQPFSGSGLSISRFYINPDNTNGNSIISLAANEVVVGYVPGSSLYVAGPLNVSGTKNFRIPHPVTDGKDLVHSAVEGPQAYLVYRGIANLVAGTANVNIDNSAGMAPGTFATIAKDAHVSHLQNHSGFDRVVPSAITGNQFTITSENSASTDAIHWVVMAQRVLDPSIPGVDSYGNLIVEPDARVEPELVRSEPDWSPVTNPTTPYVPTQPPRT